MAQSTRRDFPITSFAGAVSLAQTGFFETAESYCDMPESK